MNWYRPELKRRAKNALKRNYWKCIMVALVIFLITPSAGSVSGGAQYQSPNSAANPTKHMNPIDSIKSADPLEYISSMESADTISWSSISGYATTGILIGLAYLLIIPVLQVGGCSFFLENAWISSAGIKQLFHAFKHNYLTTVLTMFLRNLFLFLWACVFFIPYIFCLLTRSVLTLPCLFLLALPIMKAYEYRMIPYLLADRPELNCREVFRTNRKLMKKQKWALFTLDLSFWGWNVLSAFTLNILGILYVNPYRYATNAEVYLALKRAEEARLPS